MTPTIITPKRDVTLQKQVQDAFRKGKRSIVLKGKFTPPKPTWSLLDVGEKLCGITIQGENAVLDGGFITCHVLSIRNAKDVRISNVEVCHGSTEKSLWSIAKDESPYSKRVSIYYYIDGPNILITGDSTAKFIDCHTHSGKSYMCGGISIQQNAKLTEPIVFERCIIEEQKAADTGSGIDLLTLGSSVQFVGCTIRNNTSNLLYPSSHRNGQITLFPHTSAEFVDCRFESNIATPYAIDRDLSSKLSIKNCTFNTKNVVKEWGTSLNLESIIYPLHHLMAIVPAWFYFLDKANPWVAT